MLYATEDGIGESAVRPPHVLLQKGEPHPGGRGRHQKGALHQPRVRQALPRDGGEDGSALPLRAHFPGQGHRLCIAVGAKKLRHGGGGAEEVAGKAVGLLLHHPIEGAVGADGPRCASLLMVAEEDMPQLMGDGEAKAEMARTLLVI